MQHIDIVIPLYNPVSDWGRKLAFHFKALKDKLPGAELQLLIVNDGSSSDTHIRSGYQEILGNGIKAQLLSYTINQGKGYALRTGISASSSEYLVYTDLDFPYETASILRIIKALTDAQADIALGYREQDYYVSVPWFRKKLSETFRFVLRSVLRFPVTDTQCGLKGMNRKGREVFLHTRINRFLVDMEFIKLATRDRRLVIKPVVVQLRQDVEFSTMGPAILLKELVNFTRILFR